MVDSRVFVSAEKWAFAQAEKTAGQKAEPKVAHSAASRAGAMVERKVVHLAVCSVAWSDIYSAVDLAVMRAGCLVEMTAAMKVAC